MLDRSNGLEGTSTFDVHPTVGAEQALVPKRVWARAGLDETTWTTGMSVAFDNACGPGGLRPRPSR